MIWSIIYLIAVLTANYTAIWFIPLPIFGLVAVGTLIFGVTFTARDYAHNLGRKYVYVMIATSILASSVLSLVGSVDWRIILASGIAIAFSETIDTEIYQRLLAKKWLVRVLSSNSISIPLDSITFNCIAFLGIFSIPMLIQIVFGEIVTKYLTGAIVALWRIQPFSTLKNIKLPNQVRI